MFNNILLQNDLDRSVYLKMKLTYIMYISLKKGNLQGFVKIAGFISTAV